MLQWYIELQVSWTFLSGVLLLSSTKRVTGLIALLFASDKQKACSSLWKKAWMSELFTNVSLLSVIKYVIDYDIQLQVI